MTQRLVFLLLLALPLLAQAQMIGKKGGRTMTVHSFHWRAEEMIASDIGATGTCADPAKVPINSGPEVYSILCTDEPSTSVFEGYTRAPQGWDGGPLTFDLTVLQTIDEQKTVSFDIAAQCCEARDGPVDNGWGASAHMRIGATHGNNRQDTVTSGPVTPSGTCSGGDMIYWQITLDSTETEATVDSLHILSVEMRYGWTGGDHQLYATNVGTDFTADARCQGAWLLFTDESYASAATDRCTGASQSGTDNMTWDGGTWASAGVPIGTAASGADSADLDGSADTYFFLNDDDDFDGPDLTFGCWVYPDTDGVNFYVMDKDYFASSGYALRYSNSEHNFGQVNTGQQYGAAALGLNAWWHTVVRVDSATDKVELFTNGVADCGACAATGGDLPGNAKPLALGAPWSGTGTDRFQGALYECAVFNDALTATEIAEWFLCGLDGTADGSWRDGTYTGATCATISDACCN